MSSEMSEAGQAAMEEFGFEPMELSQVGAPTPGRVADRLSDLVPVLEDAEPGNTLVDRLRGDHRQAPTTHELKTMTMTRILAVTLSGRRRVVGWASSTSLDFVRSLRRR